MPRDLIEAVEAIADSLRSVAAGSPLAHVTTDQARSILSALDAARKERDARQPLSRSATSIVSIDGGGDG